MPYDKEKRSKYNKRYREIHKEKFREYQRQYMRDRVKKHHELGLCNKCNKPSLKNRLFCALHLSKEAVATRGRQRNNTAYRDGRKERQIKRTDKLKRENKCVTCAMPLNDESRMGIYCLTCYSKKKGFI